MSEGSSVVKDAQGEAGTPGIRGPLPSTQGVEGAAVHHVGGLPEDTGAGLSFELAVMSRDAESGGGPSQEVGRQVCPHSE